MATKEHIAPGVKFMRGILIVVFISGAAYFGYSYWKGRQSAVTPGSAGDGNNGLMPRGANPYAGFNPAAMDEQTLKEQFHLLISKALAMKTAAQTQVSLGIVKIDSPDFKKTSDEINVLKEKATRIEAEAVKRNIQL